MKFVVKISDGYFGGNFTQCEYEIVEAENYVRAQNIARQIPYSNDEFHIEMDKDNPFKEIADFLSKQTVNYTIFQLKPEAPEKQEKQSFEAYINKWKR